MQQYIVGLNVFGFFPLFYAIVYYAGDAWTYLTSDDEEELEEVQMWQVSNILVLPQSVSNFYYPSDLSLWVTLVCIYTTGIASPLFFRVFRLESYKIMEGERVQEN